MIMQKGSVHDIEITLDEWVIDYEWLGIVYPQDSNHGRALITPLACYDNNQWSAFSETDCKQSFPNNGKVAYFRNDSHPLAVNRLYQFRPEINQKAISQDNVHHSHFLVFDPLESKSLSHILNWTNSIRTVLDLPTFLEQGIPIDSCFSRIIYIHYSEHLYGPIYLEIDGNLLKPREYLSATHSGGNPLYLQKYLFSKDVAIELAGQLFINSISIVFPLGKIDCSLPQVTIKAALKAYKNVAERANKEQLVDKFIKELIAVYSSINPASPAIESCTIERAQYIVKSQMKMTGDLQNVLNNLPDDHPLRLEARAHEIQHQKDEIDSAVQLHRDSMEQELQKRKKEIEQESIQRRLAAEQEFQGHKKTIEQGVLKQSMEAQKRLQLLLTEANLAEQKLATAKADLKSVLQKTEQVTEQSEQRQHELDSFEQHMQAHLDQLRREPLRLLADLQITSTLRRAIFEMSAQDHSVASIVERSTVQTTQVDTHPVVEQPPMVSESRVVVSQSNFFTESAFTIPPSFEFLLTAAKQSGISSGSAKCSAAALLAGLVPAMSGPAATSVVQAVAQTIAGNRLWSIPVPLTALSPLDLLGTIASELQQFIPVGDLADIILEAQSHPQQLGIVLFEGVDRVPFLPVIAPFIQQYRAVRQQKQHVTNSSISPLRLFHPRAISHDDPYQLLANFCWPANLLLAVTLDQAPGNFIIAEAYETWFTRPEMAELKEKSLEEQKIYQVGANDWHALEKENVHKMRQFSDKGLMDSVSWQKLKLWQKIFVTAALEMKMAKNSLPAVIEKLWLDASDDEREL